MTAGPRVDIDGTARLAATMAASRAAIERLTPTGSLAALAAIARARAPRRRGDLAASVTTNRAPGVGTIAVTARHSWPVHSGVPSLRMPARPFLTKAGAAGTPALLADYTTQLRAALALIKGA